MQWTPAEAIRTDACSKGLDEQMRFRSLAPGPLWQAMSCGPAGEVGRRLVGWYSGCVRRRRRALALHRAPRAQLCSAKEGVGPGIQNANGKCNVVICRAIFILHVVQLAGVAASATRDP
jgi:hypothetical protein